MFSIIVPKHEIIKEEGSLNFIKEKLTVLMNLALSIWEIDLADVIQSSPENGGFASLEKILNGTVDKVVALPFAIMDKTSFSKYNSSHFTYAHLTKSFKGLYFKEINNNGIFI